MELEVFFEVVVDGQHSFYTGITQNISHVCIFLGTLQTMPIGRTMHLSFALVITAKLLFIEGHFKLNADLRVLFSGTNQAFQDHEYFESLAGTSSNVQIIARSDSREKTKTTSVS